MSHRMIGIDAVRVACRDLDCSSYYQLWKLLLNRLPERSALQPEFTTRDQKQVRGVTVWVEGQKHEFVFSRRLNFE